MELLLSRNTLITLSPLHLKSRNPNPNYNPNPKFLIPIRPKSRPIAIARSISTPTSFGGWDDPELLEAEPSSIRGLMASIGIEDGKQALLFILGFLSALGISRVRFSSLLLLPFSVLVFVMGFLAGLAQIRVFTKKFADLEGFLSDLGDSDGNFDLRKVKGFLELAEGARRAGDALGFDFGGEKRQGSKTGRKKKDFVGVGSDFVQYLGGLFQENVAGLNTAKTKDFSNGEVADKPVSNGGRFEQNAEDKEAKKLYQSENKLHAKEMLSYDEELNGPNASHGYKSRQGTVQKTVLKRNYERRVFQSDVHGSSNHRDQRKVSNIDFFTSKSEASSTLEETLEISNKSYDPSSRSKFEEGTINTNQQPVNYIEEGKNLSSTTMSVDEEFSEYMKEATELLKTARECMANKADEETVDNTLYKTARLLTAAIEIRPMSLLAVGQLGNTYLLHGELKLNISRELRSLLRRNDTFPNRRGHMAWRKNLDGLSREVISPVLVEVCEECEELLVEAGRKYRMALSIDGNDVRALYNWGLALSFRAQLIADIGPEAAVDADKVYLAAIDKFDAMMSKGNLYATNALYRWGIALRERSQLRPYNSRERTKLLHQAKSLFEDVISVESENNQAREALASCMLELGYNRRW